MLGRDAVISVLKDTLNISTADQTEVVFLGQDSGLTRFANSYIHQNVAETNTEVRVRAVIGKRIGVATTNDLSVASLRRTVESAISIARLQAENPDFVSLPGALPVQPIDAFVEATANCTPEDRATGVAAICSESLRRNLSASGAFSTGVSEVAVANSLGVQCYQASTSADLTTVVMGENSSGYANAVSADMREIDPGALGLEAIDKAVRGANPEELEPGKYDVVLQPYATSEFLDFMAYLGFSALAVQEGRSFMAGKFGQRIVGENITVWDDGLAAGTLPMAFDFEGVPKQRVTLIEQGIARGVVYDSYTAQKEGKQSTGHALPAPNTAGPVAAHMFMALGDASVDDMVASTERGLWVTRFHYTNPVHPLLAIITGMTRDGTFLIENGRITRPVKNLRFTQSILEALSNVEMVGRDGKLQQTWFPANLVPALKIKGFNFSGATEF